MKTTFVPIHGSRPYGEGDLQVAFDKGTVKDAPRIDPAGHLTPEEERDLWDYYGYQHDSTTTTDYGYGKAYTEDRADRDYTWESDQETDDAMTRSEEELRVGKQREATGTVRLRKYVVTEQPADDGLRPARRGASGAGADHRRQRRRRHTAVQTSPRPSTR